MQIPTHQAPKWGPDACHDCHHEAVVKRKLHGLILEEKPLMQGLSGEGGVAAGGTRTALLSCIHCTYTFRLG